MSSSPLFFAASGRGAQEKTIVPGSLDRQCETANRPEPNTLLWAGRDAAEDVTGTSFAPIQGQVRQRHAVQPRLRFRQSAVTRRSFSRANRRRPLLRALSTWHTSVVIGSHCIVLMGLLATATQAWAFEFLAVGAPRELDASKLVEFDVSGSPLSIRYQPIHDRLSFGRGGLSADTAAPMVWFFREANRRFERATQRRMRCRAVQDPACVMSNRTRYAAHERDRIAFSAGAKTRRIAGQPAQSQRRRRRRSSQAARTGESRLFHTLLPVTGGLGFLAADMKNATTSVSESRAIAGCDASSGCLGSRASRSSHEPLG